ncbi:MAG TPA: NCS2 family permease [Gemmatimonadales bacterium]|nr:NCS2 family permease [Gemmatimonadales bacterium]
MSAPPAAPAPPAPRAAHPLLRRFDLAGRGTTVGREVRGGIATFLTMAYILVANPAILAAAGVPFAPAVAATAAAAALCSVLMGLGANFPLALAPGMGLNAILAFQVAPAAGGWGPAMGIVVLDGLVVLALVLLGLREAVMEAIPRDLRRAIGVGIGLFIAFVGAVNAKLVVVPTGTVAGIVENPGATLPPVAYGSLHAPEAWVAAAGLLVTVFLVARRTTGAILLGIVAATLLGFVAGIAHLPSGAWVGLPRFDTVGRADVGAALRLGVLPLLIPVIMVDFFDTIGTVTGIAEEAGLDRDHAGGGIPHLKRILAIDALSASLGGLFGVSSATSYVESAAGVAEGARTGLSAVVAGLCFGLAILAAPLAAVVPPSATAPALIVVGFLMFQQVTRIDFQALDTAIPSFVLLATIPFTYSISHGIGYGFITYVGIQVCSGRARAVHPVMYATAAAFAGYFWWA